MKVKTKSGTETEKLGEKIARKISPRKKRATVIFLKGDLGAGKTTFAKGFARFFKVTEVKSPTFVVMKRYPLEEGDFNLLYHLDFYRLEEGDPVGDLDLDRVLNEERSIILVEWPEKISFDEEAITINFNFTSEKEREIELPDDLLD